MTSSLPLLLTGVAILWVIRCALTYGHRTKNMPPGPPTLPFTGNLHQFPKGHSHIKFTEWAAKYGVTDRQLVKEVVERRSSIYSHRPDYYVSHDLITKGNHLLVMQYGDKWRTFRRLIHQHFMEPMVDSQHLDIVNAAEAIQLVRDYLVDPGAPHVASQAGLLLTGFSCSLWNPDIRTNWSKHGPPLQAHGGMVPDNGNRRNTHHQAIGAQMQTLYTEILTKVIERRDKGQNIGTFMDRILDGQEKHQLPWDQLTFIGGVLMEGGSDTNSSLIIAIVQALVLSPHIQRKAHAEIDAVVGNTQSPVWSDLEHLPYINMIIKEGHRWRPVLPLCFPHALGEDDDWVAGKLLPKGTVVMINTWGMNMDPSQPHDPSKFIPERYQHHPKLAPEYAAGGWENRDHYGFGVGRRICPGMHLAERNMFLSIAKLLWAFEFQPGRNDIVSDPVTGYRQGFLYCAKDYECRPVVRSQSIRDTIESEYASAQSNVFSRFTEGCTGVMEKVNRSCDAFLFGVLA
ncbi:cytochrome P450 [Aspergillus californicus]